MAVAPAVWRPLLACCLLCLPGASLALRAQGQGVHKSLRQEAPRSFLAVDEDPVSFDEKPELRQVKGRQVPHYTVNLDLPPRQRWKHLVPHFRDRWIEIMPYRQAFIEKLNRTNLELLINSIHWDKEYIEELEGILEEINYTQSTLFMSQVGHLKYELGVTQAFECSGVIAAAENGTVFQGRNLDLPDGQAWSRTLEIDVTFTSGGKPLFSSPSFFGMVATPDGSRHGGFSLQQNTRNFGTIRTRSAWEKHAVRAAKAGARPISFEMRKHLQYTKTFEDMVAKVRTTDFIAPQYVISAGAKPYEGAVITVANWSPAGAREKPHDTRRLSKEEGILYLVQTNDDHWAEPEDERREGIFMSMEQLGKKDVGTRDRVWKTMRRDPACHGFTWQTWMAAPAVGYFQITRDPC